jgi:hypothetical protein
MNRVLAAGAWMTVAASLVVAAAAHAAVDHCSLLKPAEVSQALGAPVEGHATDERCHFAGGGREVTLVVKTKEDFDREKKLAAGTAGARLGMRVAPFAGVSDEAIFFGHPETEGLEVCFPTPSHSALLQVKTRQGREGDLAAATTLAKLIVQRLN